MNLIFSPKNYLQFIDLLSDQLQLATTEVSGLVNKTLIADYYLELPIIIKDQATKFAQNLTSATNQKFLGGFGPSLDFHWSSAENRIKLIEANTNAAFMGLSIPLYQSAELSSELTTDDLCSQFLEITQSTNSTAKESLAIVDENPPTQGLYIEFLFYKKIFSKEFESVQILDPKQLTGQESCVYNRLTDFYFENLENQRLQNLWMSKLRKVTPNPDDYRIFADKTNIIQWSRNPNLSENIAKLEVVTNENKEEVWSKRKGLFFKPNQSFGAKMTYRGGSISRKHFEQLLELKSALAQEFIPAPELSTLANGNLKYDLRFYFFKGKVTQSVARLYQGQVTNSKTPGGGFAPIKWYK